MDEGSVIVSGLPRSGTSMMMGMLRAGGLVPLMDDARPADADNPRGYFEYGPVRRLREDASWLAGARGKVVKIVSPLLDALPADIACSVIFMERDLDEILASQRALLVRRAEAGVIGPEILDPSRLDQEDARLRPLYEEHLCRVRQWLRLRENTRVLDVAYHGVLADPKAPLARCRAFWVFPLTWRPWPVPWTGLAKAVCARGSPKISPSNNSPQ